MMTVGKRRDMPYAELRNAYDAAHRDSMYAELMTLTVIRRLFNEGKIDKVKALDAVWRNAAFTLAAASEGRNTYLADAWGEE